MTPEEKLESFISVFIPGKKYTFVKYGDFGFLQKIQGRLLSVQRCQYAQYQHACLVVIKAKGKRHVWEFIFHPGEGHYSGNLPTVWEGWVDPNTEMFGPREKSQATGLEMQKSRYTSFDRRYLLDAIASVPDVPLFTSNQGRDVAKSAGMAA